MLYIQTATGEISDHRFTDLESLLPINTLIVLNDSRVIPARVFGTRPVKPDGQGGGRVEVLYHKWLGDHTAEAVIGSGSSLAAGEWIELPSDWRCELLEPKALDGIKVRYLKPDGVPATHTELVGYLNQFGLPPTPPYIKRKLAAGEAFANGSDVIKSDHERYQTVYASRDGSVAAPTAGLHFTESMLNHLRGQGHDLCNVTLHVGLGTFAPVRVDDLADHDMHEEAYSVERSFTEEYAARLNDGSPVLAVGTTSLRVLHTLRNLPSGSMNRSENDITGTTKAFIYPGQGTDACNLLLTNFHLPRSTLLALVYAFGGEELLRKAYSHAISSRYRFYSYGDCMLIDRRS
jgi:S-adenosylmethionine:tRNA ribosyltransferase-isomerase